MAKFQFPLKPIFSLASWSHSNRSDWSLKRLSFTTFTSVTGNQELLWVTTVIRSWQREINMSSTKEFESLEKILDEHLPAAELAEVKRILYGKQVE